MTKTLLIKFFVTLVIFFVAATSFAETTLNFLINEKPLTIYKYEDLRISSSLQCPGLKKGQFCEELKFLKTLKNSKLKATLHSGQSYGSAVCNEHLKGLVIMAKTTLGDENAFCKIDSLYVELGTLGYYYNN